MKVSMFHLMPHRELPDDFEDRYHSVWVDPPWSELADPERVGQYYNWTLDELIYADKMGMDGICVNEHHQNAYGFMPNPNLMGSVLARSTKNAALVQMGATLPTTHPPVRIAEEYAMLDCISGGRLVAGMPLGTSADANFCYGIPPIVQRERYREAHDLIVDAWTRDEMFAFNGKYTQLRYVNVWPKPIQKPHPPIWVPGGGSSSTWDFVCEKNYCYCYLSYYGNLFATKIMEKFWERVDYNGLDANPYRAGIPTARGGVGDGCTGGKGLRKTHPVLLQQVHGHGPRIPGRAGISGLQEPGQPDQAAWRRQGRPDGTVERMEVQGLRR